MTPPLLPASTAPFAPRASSVSVVLGSKVEPWLTQTLKRIRQEEQRRYNREEQRRQKRVKKRLLNNVLQHQRYLTEILSSPNAIWTLASIMLPKTPEADFEREAHNPLVEAVMKYETIQIEGYVVCVDMALRNEVTYKLTNDTIGTLIEHHKEIYRVEVAHTCDWPDGKQWHKDIHEKFVRTINEFVFYTHVSALKGLKEDGTGKFINEKSEEVKKGILSRMRLPHRCASDVIQQTSVIPIDNVWSQPGIQSCQPAFEPRALPSSFAILLPASTNDGTVWVPIAQRNPAPTPAFTQPHLTTHLSYNPFQQTALISARSFSSMPDATDYGVGMPLFEMGDSCSFCPGQCQECTATHVFPIPWMTASSQW